MHSTTKAEPLGGLPAPTFLFFILLLLTACSDELILKQRCSQNGTYCEDLRLTNNNATVQQNLTQAYDYRDPTNNTVYEEITP